MEMDVCQNSPIIVIHSDDEDEDDDVVLLGTEKNTDDAEKRDEDDVIFVSEEPSTSINIKPSPRNIKNNESGPRRSSSSSDDDSDSCSIPQLRYFDSELSSVSLVDDILRPLDLSQGLVQTTDVLPTVINHKLTIIKPLQATCSAAAFPEQVQDSMVKTADGIEMNPEKIIHDFDLTAGKDVDSAAFVGSSVKIERFKPLKLPEGAEPLASQSLNTPVCRIDPGKECFNLCSQEDKDVALTGSTLLDASSASSETCLGKGFPEKEKSHLSGSFCGSNASWDSSPGKLAIGTYASDTSLAPNVNMNHLCDNRTGGASAMLSPQPSTTDVPEKTTSMLSQALATPDTNPGKSHSSLLLPSVGYLNEGNSKPGTSKNLYSPQISHLPSKAPILKSRIPPTNSSPLTLDINGLNTEDLSSLLDLFSDEGDLVTSTKPTVHGKLAVSGQSVKDNTNIGEPESSSSITPKNVQSSPTSTNPMDVCNSRFSSVSIAHTFSVSQDGLANSDVCFLNNSLSASKQLTNSPVVVDSTLACSESSIPSVSLSGRQQYLLKSVSAIKHRYAHMKSRKYSSPHSRFLASSHSSARTTKYGLPQRSTWHKDKLANVKKLLVNKPAQDISDLVTKCSDINLESGSSYSKTEHTNPTEWLVVSPKSSQNTCKSRVSAVTDEHHANKRQKLADKLPEEKPSVKIRLKLSPSANGAESNCETLAEIQPSNIGLKKSIIRRHASMTGESDLQGQQSQSGIHRSASESGLLKADGNTDQVICDTCQKPVASAMLSKCCKGHALCTACLEVQVKAILTGDVKQKNIKCPADACIEILSFDELKRALPSFVVDILEEKLDKEYLSYITKWMFTDEKLKSRSEFATSDTGMPPCPALSMRKYEEIYTQESRDPTEDLPTFWTPMERGSPVMVFDVVPDTEEYRALAFQFHETLTFGDFDIVRIIRIQNPILWKYFALKRSEMVQENDGMDVTEKQLYHGTHRSTLEAIARKGFDWRLSGKHGTVYGCGSYFAKSARYSHGYTDRSGNGISVKSGSGPGRIPQPSLGMAPLGMGFTSTSSNYLARSHTRPQACFILSQSALVPLMQVPPMITSQNQPPQPPPAHYHLPAPPPAHGQMSSLQVPAHNQTFNPVPNKATTSTGPSSSCGTTSSNPSFRNVMPVVSSSSSLPILPGPSSLRSPYIQPFAVYHTCLNSKTINAVPLCNSLDFQSTSHSSFTAMDSHFTSAPLCPNQSSSFQTQPSFASSRNIYASPSMSANKLGLPPSSNTSIFSVGSLLGHVGSHSHSKLAAVSSTSTGMKGPADNKPTSSRSTKRAYERGTADLTKTFARDTNCETHFMFVARVLVGRHTGGKAGLKRPPPLDENNPFGKSYDSCVDDIFCPQVFVIFDSNQAYPEYIIEYNWHKD
ncbi:hypothetical protein BsWGS_18994 [Bradybaena similaris]